MELNVTFRHMQPSEPIREHIVSRFEKLDKYLLKPESVHFVLETEKFRRRVEITLTDNGNRITALEEGPDMYEAIDKALDKIKRQLDKHKQKVISHRA